MYFVTQYWVTFLLTWFAVSEIAAVSNKHAAVLSEETPISSRYSSSSAKRVVRQHAHSPLFAF